MAGSAGGLRTRVHRSGDAVAGLERVTLTGVVGRTAKAHRVLDHEGLGAAGGDVQAVQRVGDVRLVQEVEQPVGVAVLTGRGVGDVLEALVAQRGDGDTVRVRVGDHERDVVAVAGPDDTVDGGGGLEVLHGRDLAGGPGLVAGGERREREAAAGEGTRDDGDGQTTLGATLHWNFLPLSTMKWQG